MKRMTKPAAESKTFDGYLAGMNPRQRAALEKLRKAIRSAAPNAEECICYGVPAFRLKGKFLVALGAAAKHCAFYSGSTLQAFNMDLRGYHTSKGTIHFQPEQPLPPALVRKLVEAPIAQQESRP